MGSPKNHLLHLLLLLLLLHCSSSAAASDLTTLIYKGCANQNFQNQIASENLKTLFTILVSQSSTTNFYKTTTGRNGNESNDQSTTSITGLYQCRGDLSNNDCNTCVKKLPETIQRVCNRDTIASRVQLVGCYMRYEVIGFQQVPATELLYKQCGSRQASGSGFDQRLQAALSLIPKGVSNGKGYYAGAYQSVYVLGQCEGDLGGGECVNCVKNAAEIGRSECQTSISGHIFLQQCYISYTYYPEGVPGAAGGVAGVGGVETGAAEIDGEGGGGGGRTNTQKTVAIVFGGLAGLGLVVAFLLVLKSAFRKKKDHYSYGGY